MIDDNKVVSITDYTKDPIPDVELDSSPGESEVVIRKNESLSVAAATAEKFVQSIVDGQLSVRDAARKCGVSLTQFMQDSQVRAKVEKLLNSYGAHPEVRKDVVRAKLMDLALNGSEKACVQALKLLGQDPEVGLFSHGPSGPKHSTAVNINIGDNTRKVLDKLKVNEGNVIDTAAVQETEES